jgi:hypothetical protein
MCPEQEIKHAREMGMRVFVLLSLVENNLISNVTVAETKSLENVEELKTEFKLFFDENPKELNKHEKTAC